MVELLKNQYSQEWIRNLAKHLHKIEPTIKRKEFIDKVIGNPWKEFELT